jgi:uncharacterized repeat protein (TIGR01451 family)
VRSSKAILAACAAAVLGLSTVVVAGAAISGSSGQVIKLATPPVSVALNKLENATSTYAFDEKQNVTLTSAIPVDAVNPGTYTSFPAGSAKVAVGTVVDSHLIHSDIPSRSFTAHRSGTVTFANDIVGVVGSTSKLAGSDSLGATGTTYAGSTQWRGLEGGENGWASGDKFTISADHRSLTFDINTYVMDEIRVITKHANTLVTSISDSPDPVQAGANVTYTVTVTNGGASTAAGVSVQDVFPGATLVSATSSGGCTGTTTVTCALGSITPGGSAAATIIVTSPSTVPAGGTITNTATSPPGLAPAGTATTTVVSPSLTTSIADAPDPVTAGNDVQYILTVTNNGIAPVANAHVVDTLPSGSSLKTATSSGGCSGSGPVDCALGALAVGASAQAQLVVTSPATVPAGGTMTNSAVATPGTNTAGTQDTAVEAPQDGVSKGFVSPGGSLTIPGDDPATLSLPNTGNGAPVEITQGDGSFCSGSCEGPATTISEFAGYSDPNQPISLLLTYQFPDAPDSLTNAAAAYGSTIYKNDDPGNPTVGTVVPFCSTFGAGVAVPHPCVDARTITQPTPNSFVVTFTIKYVSGDPKFARR